VDPVPARVLLVEDDRRARTSIARLLRKRGYQVTLCDGVRSACDQLAHADFDAVITDFWMADGTGSDVIAAARRRTPPIAAVVVTAAPPSIHDLQVPCLVKPLGADELLPVVAALVEDTRERRTT